MHAAVMWGYCGLIELLHERGMPLDTEDHDKQTPLALAMGNGSGKIVEYLHSQGVLK